eukprot:122166_1
MDMEWLTQHAPVTMSVIFGLALAWMIAGRCCSTHVDKEPELKKAPIIPRNFTLSQLLPFNGVVPTDGDSKVGTKQPPPPVYISVERTVFDVTESEFYAPGGSYHLFAGHDVSFALAKLSFDHDDFDILDLSNLNYGEKQTLNDWKMKFQHEKCYPIVGKLVHPPCAESVPQMTVEDLALHKGCEEIPEGSAAAPIYVAVKGDIFDVSFGGMEMYGKGCTYHLFAGRDASRALAKMSFDVEHLDSPCTDDLTEDEQAVLSDWHNRFVTKGYPIVGTLKSQQQK